MEIGEHWAYREKAQTTGWPVLPVEIVQLGPPRSRKVRVKFLDGEYPGLDQWVPQVRLRVPWSDVDAWLRDERLSAEARAASHEPVKTPARWAAWLVCLAYPGPGDFYITYPDEPQPIIEIQEIASVAAAVQLNPEELLPEPGAFIDRAGTYIAPWLTALRVARRVAETVPEEVLSKVREEERTLQREAIHGRPFDYGRGLSGFVPPSVCATWLQEREPAFALVREWCGAEVVAHFDEIEILRAEVVRLRELVEEAAKRLEDEGHLRIARQVRIKLDTPVLHENVKGL